MTLVIQKPWGTNYEGWRHPLTPYYRKGTEIFPCHPKPGTFGYRNWRGVILQSESGLRPAALERYLRDIEGARCSLIVAGWAMDNMKPLDFLWSEQPVFSLSAEQEDQAAASVEAAEQGGLRLGCMRAGRRRGWRLEVRCRPACEGGVFCRHTRPIRTDAGIDVGQQFLRGS